MPIRLSAYAASTIVIGTMASGNNASGAHTVNSGSNLALLVLIGTHQGTISSVSWNSNSLTKIAEGASAFNECGSIWYLINPTPGTGNIVVSMSGGSWYGWAAINLSKVKNTSTLTNAINNGNSNSASVAITPSSSSNLVVAVVGSEAAPAVGTGFTQFYILQGQSYENMGSEYIQLIDSSAQTMNFSLNSSQRWGIASCCIEPNSLVYTSLRSMASIRTVAGTRTNV